MEFRGKSMYQDKLPLWMQTLLDTTSVDAWSEDPDRLLNLEGSNSTKGSLTYEM